MTELNVLITDDHWIARAAIINLIPQLGSSIQSFEAATAEETLKILESDQTLDLHILDLNLPDAQWYDTLIRARQLRPSLPIVVMSVNEERDSVLRCLECGVAGYLPKTADPERILSTLRRVLAGEVALPHRLLNTTSIGIENQAIASDSVFAKVCSQTETLTPRQMDIFRLLGKDLNNSEIANELDLSVNTVRVHLNAVMTKLGIRKRTELASISSRCSAQGHIEAA